MTETTTCHFDAFISLAEPEATLQTPAVVPPQGMRHSLHLSRRCPHCVSQQVGFVILMGQGEKRGWQNFVLTCIAQPSAWF